MTLVRIFIPPSLSSSTVVTKEKETSSYYKLQSPSHNDFFYWYQTHAKRKTPCKWCKEETKKIMVCVEKRKMFFHDSHEKQRERERVSSSLYSTTNVSLIHLQRKTGTKSEGENKESKVIRGFGRRWENVILAIKFCLPFSFLLSSLLCLHNIM